MPGFGCQTIVLHNSEVKGMPRVITLIIVLILGSHTVVTAQDNINDSVNKKRVKRGLQLVNQGRCNDCHTPFVESKDGLMPDTKRTL